jgi:hypothetical protein
MALAIGLLALLVALVSLSATGALALKLKLVKPRMRMPDMTQPEPRNLPTTGSSMAELLAPVVTMTIPSGDGGISVRENFLERDGLVLVVSTSCAACRYLVAESAELLSSAGVRVLVSAPSIDRGIEFIEQDCKTDSVTYQVDLFGERAQALGVTETPFAITVENGVLAGAHVVVTRRQLEALLARQTVMASTRPEEDLS